METRKKGKGEQGDDVTTWSVWADQPGTSEEATTNASRFSFHQPRDGSEMMSGAVVSALVVVAADAAVVIKSRLAREREAGEERQQSHLLGSSRLCLTI